MKPTEIVTIAVPSVAAVMAAAGSTARTVDALALAGGLFGLARLGQARIGLHVAASAPTREAIDKAARSLMVGGIGVATALMALFVTSSGRSRCE